MNRWHATTNPQHTLRVSAARVSGKNSRFIDEQTSKPAPREAPPSA